MDKSQPLMISPDHDGNYLAFISSCRGSNESSKSDHGKSVMNSIYETIMSDHGESS